MKQSQDKHVDEKMLREGATAQRRIVNCQLLTWLRARQEQQSALVGTPCAERPRAFPCAGAEKIGVVFYIEQRFNAEFGEFEPCTITSTGTGAYIFRRYDNMRIGQNRRAGQALEDSDAYADDAIMSVDDIVSEWGPLSYHHLPRCAYWKSEWQLHKEQDAPNDSAPAPAAVAVDAHEGVFLSLIHI